MGSGIGSALIGVLDAYIYCKLILHDCCINIDEKHSLIKVNGSFWMNFMETPLSISDQGAELAHTKETNDGLYNLSIKLGVSLLKLRRDFNQIIKFKNKDKIPMDKPYVTLSFRKGDKFLENHKTPDTSKYVNAIINHSQSPLFLMSDDYSLIRDFMKHVNTTKIKTLNNDDDRGFFLNDWKFWSQRAKYNSILRFIKQVNTAIESKIYVGTKITNVYTLIEVLSNAETVFLNIDM